VFLALVITGAFRTSHAQDTILSVLCRAAAQLTDGRANLDERTLLTTRRIFADCTRQDPKDARCYYDIGLTDLYIADVSERQGDKSAAQQRIDSAIENPRRSIDLNAGFGDAHALLAELYGRKIGYSGAFTAMRIGSKAQAETEKALELDPNDRGSTS